MPRMSVCRVYLLRHGATANNLASPPRLQGCGVNLGLSPEGRRQAERTGDFFRSRPLAAVYSSPLLRAVETAHFVAQSQGLEIRPVPSLREVDVGNWEGRSWDEIARDDAEAYGRFRNDPAVHPYAGGETLLEVQRRVTPVLEQLASAHQGQQIAVVAHNVVNRSFLGGLLQLPLVHVRHIRQDNCGVNILDWIDGQFELRTWNCILHLD